MFERADSASKDLGRGTAALLLHSLLQMERSRHPSLRGWGCQRRGPWLMVLNHGWAPVP